MRVVGGLLRAGWSNNGVVRVAVYLCLCERVELFMRDQCVIGEEWRQI